MEILENSIKLTGEEIEDLKYDCVKGSKKIVEQGRWETFFEGIIKIKNKYYLINWVEGSTELQDNYGCEDGEFKEVIEIESISKKWIEKCKNIKEINQNNDVEMEKLLIELKEFSDEKERLISNCKEMILMYQEKIAFYHSQLDVKETNIKKQLFGMLDEDKMKETKTEKNYKLPSGKLIIKKKSQSMKLKVDYFDHEIPDRFIKVEKSVKWGDFKKILKIDGDCVINTQTGEILYSVEIEKKPAGTLEIKFY